MSYRFLLIGEQPQKSSPLLTWAKSLQRTGNSVEFIPDLGKISTRYLIQKIKETDAVIFQGYKDISLYEIRQLSLVSIFNKPLIRKWSGSDVLYCYNYKKTYKRSKLLNNLVSQNISSETESLINELKKINFYCTLIKPILSEPINFPVTNKNLPQSVLVYLPDGRENFYGYNQVNQLIPLFRNLHFYIIANTKNLFDIYPNVTNLGWQDDLDKVWKKTGCLLRLTEHDGVSRMVCEALVRGKYIIFSQKLDGCWQATNIDSAKQHLTNFSKIQTINIKGLKAAKKLLTPHNDKILLEKILASKRYISYYTKFKCFLIFILTSFLIITSNNNESSNKEN